MAHPQHSRGRGIDTGGFLEDYRTFRANQLANEEESWNIGISQSLIGDQVTFIGTLTNYNLFLLYLKRDKNFF